MVRLIGIALLAVGCTNVHRPPASCPDATPARASAATERSWVLSTRHLHGVKASALALSPQFLWVATCAAASCNLKQFDFTTLEQKGERSADFPQAGQPRLAVLGNTLVLKTDHGFATFDATTGQARDRWVDEEAYSYATLERLDGELYVHFDADPMPALRGVRRVEGSRGVLTKVPGIPASRLIRTEQGTNVEYTFHAEGVPPSSLGPMQGWRDVRGQSVGDTAVISRAVSPTSIEIALLPQRPTGGLELPGDGVQGVRVMDAGSAVWLDTRGLFSGAQYFLVDKAEQRLRASVVPQVRSRCPMNVEAAASAQGLAVVENDENCAPSIRVIRVGAP